MAVLILIKAVVVMIVRRYGCVCEDGEDGCCDDCGGDDDVDGCCDEECDDDDDDREGARDEG